MASDADRPAAGESLEDSLPEKSFQKRGPTAGVARTVGIYGLRNAGKTCYLATALLGMSSSPGCSIILADEYSRELLFNSWAALDRGEVPPATELLLNKIAGSIIIETQSPANDPPQLADEVEQEASPQSTAEIATVGEAEGQAEGQAVAESSREEEAGTPPRELSARVKRQIPFCTADFGGRLCERGDTGAPRLTAEFNQWLESADCLLFFLAVDQLQDPREAQERLREVDALLSRLLETGPVGQAITRPLAVLVTKWDLVSDLSGTPEEELEKLREFLLTGVGDLGRVAVEKIDRAGNTVSIFPVSTFGGHIDGRPIRPLKPFNLHQPLIWALQEVDNCLWEKAEREAQAALSGVWKRYPAAIRAYQRLIDGYGIVAGAIYEKAQGRVQELKRQANTRRTRLGIVIAIILVVLLSSTGWIVYHSNVKQQYQMVLTTKTQLESLQRQWKQLSEQPRADISTLSDFLKKLTAAKKQQQEALSKLQKQSSLVRTQYMQDLVTIGNRLDEMTEVASEQFERNQKFDSEWQTLQKNLEGSEEQVLTAIDGFVRNFPPEEYPLRGREFAELNRIRQDILFAIDNRDFQRIKSEFEALEKLAQQSDSSEQVKEKAKSLRETFASYRKVAGVPRQHLEDISAMEAEVYKILDDKEWQVVELFKKNNPEAFQACAEMAKKYLDNASNAPGGQQLHKDQAEQCIRDCLDQRWKEVYKAFYDRVRLVDKAEKLSDADKAAEEAIQWAKDAELRFKEYMPVNCDTQRKFIETWQAWSDSLAPKDTRDLEVTVDPAQTNRNVWFQLLANGAALRQKGTTTTETGWFSEKTRFTFELPVQDFKNSPCKIQVYATVDAWGPWNSHFKSDEVELLEVLWGNHGRVIVEAPGYGTVGPAKIIFDLASPALTPPPLPEP